MSDTENENTEPEQGTDSGDAIEVGRRLREAREQAGIDVNELAGRLRLTVSHVEAMEEGRFDVFAAPLYARGYVTNYARIVGTKPEPLVELLPAGDEEPPLTAATGAPPGQRLAENLVRVATYAIGTVVLALPILWWASEGSMDALLGGSNAPAPPAVTEAGNTVADAGEEKAADATGESSETQQAPADDQPVMASMAMPRSKPEPGAGASEDTGATGDAAAGSGDAPAMEPPEGLVLEVSADSWVEIRDAAGERLEYDLLRAGSTHTYRGTAPYRVLVGNAEAVSVRYNGAPFDLTPHVQGNLARFEVGSEPAGG